MSAPDDGTLRAILDGMRHGSVHITADRCSGDSRAVAAFCDLVRVAPALAAEVLRLRERVARAEAAHDALRAAVRDFLDTPASCYGVALQAVVDALDGDAPNGIADAARAHLAADDALSLARRTDAADVPTAEARALAARECLAGLVGYTGEAGR